MVCRTLLVDIASMGSLQAPCILCAEKALVETGPDHVDIGLQGLDVWVESVAGLLAVQAATHYSPADEGLESKHIWLPQTVARCA